MSEQTPEQKVINMEAQLEAHRSTADFWRSKAEKLTSQLKEISTTTSPQTDSELTDRQIKLRDATEALHEALVVIEEYGGTAEREGEFKQVAMKYGVDHTIAPEEMIERLGYEREYWKERSYYLHDELKKIEKASESTVESADTIERFSAEIEHLSAERDDFRALAKEWQDLAVETKAELSRLRDDLSSQGPIGKIVYRAEEHERL